MDERFRKKAHETLKDPEALRRVLREASVKADRNRHKLRGVWSNLKALLRMVQAWVRRDYREAPWRSLVAAMAAILYFLNPFDLIPDFIALGGYIDDAVFIGWVVTAVRRDLEKFRLWEKTIPAQVIDGGRNIH